LNAPRDLTLEPGTTVLSDRIGFLPARQAMNRKNPMHPTRLRKPPPPPPLDSHQLQLSFPST
jgi:hypothetical protein